MKKPQISDKAMVLPATIIVGDVTIEEDCGIWYGTVIRGNFGPIRIGRGSNIQDNCTLHAEQGMDIGPSVTVGHACLLHGCTVGENSLIGMGSLLMEGSQVGKNCIIGAGSLLTEGTVIPDNSLAYGRPAKVARQLTAEEILHNGLSAAHYIEEAKEAMADLRED